MKVPFFSHFVLSFTLELKFQVYYSTRIVVVPVMAIEGKCKVRRKHELPAFNAPSEFQHIFFCQNQYDPDTRVIKKVTYLLSHLIICFNFSKQLIFRFPI